LWGGKKIQQNTLGRKPRKRGPYTGGKDTLGSSGGEERFPNKGEEGEQTSPLEPGRSTAGRVINHEGAIAYGSQANCCVPSPTSSLYQKTVGKKEGCGKDLETQKQDVKGVPGKRSCGGVRTSVSRPVRPDDVSMTWTKTGNRISPTHLIRGGENIDRIPFSGLWRKGGEQAGRANPGSQGRTG